MAFCGNCGNPLKEGAAFCSACGTAAPQIDVQPAPDPHVASAAAGDAAPNGGSVAAQSTVVQQASSAVPAVDSKSKVAAGLLAIFLGALGIHKFYLGYTTAGIIMLVVSLVGGIIVVGPLVMGIIGIVEGIIYLTKTDQQFYEIYVLGDKPWF